MSASTIWTRRRAPIAPRRCSPPPCPVGTDSKSAHGRSTRVWTVVTPKVRQIELPDVPAVALTLQNDPDITWTGTNFVLGYTDYVAGKVGYVARVDTDGNVGSGAPVPTPDGTGIIGSRIRVAASRSTVAAIYAQANPATAPLLTIFDSTGGVLAGPVTLPGGTGATILGLAGTSDGYVALLRDSTGTKTTFVSVAGAIGVTLPAFGLSDAIDADGASDGPTAMFALWNATNVMFGATTGLTPLSTTGVLAGLYLEPTVAIAGYNGHFTVSKGNSGTFEYKQVGCLPMP